MMRSGASQSKLTCTDCKQDVSGDIKHVTLHYEVEQFHTVPAHNGFGSGSGGRGPPGAPLILMVQCVSPARTES